MTGTGTETETGPETAPAGPPGVTFGVDLSRGFTEWLATKRISLAMTTCQVGRLILSCLDEEGQLWSYKAFPLIHDVYPASWKKFRHWSGVKRSQMSPMSPMASMS